MKTKSLYKVIELLELKLRIAIELFDKNQMNIYQERLAEALKKQKY